MRRERSLFEESIQDYLRAAAHFLFWLAGSGTTLDAITAADIDDAITSEDRRGA